MGPARGRATIDGFFFFLFFFFFFHFGRGIGRFFSGVARARVRFFGTVIALARG